MDLKNLEHQRLFILKRLRILKFLSVLEALLVGFLVFVFIKDAIVCVASAVLVGVFFFRFTSKKLLHAKKELEFQVLNLFLRRQGAKFQSQGLSESEFKKFNLITNLKEFKSQNCFEFKNFKIYDLWLRTQENQNFCGILLQSKTNIKNVKNSSFEAIFNKIKDKNFNTQFCFCKENFLLIATLSNPFFINLEWDLKHNFEILEQNLNKINSILL